MASLFVLIVRRPSSALRGSLQRLMLEVDSGVFVGRIPAKVVRALWEDAVEHSASAVLVGAARNEAGFAVRTHGPSRREVVDHFGIPLVRYRKQIAAGNPRSGDETTPIAR